MKAGDRVMLVWACCARGRSHIGWVGEIEEIVDVTKAPCSCGNVTKGRHAWVTIGGRGVVLLSWLRPVIDPDGNVYAPVLEEITA